MVKISLVALLFITCLTPFSVRFGVPYKVALLTVAIGVIACAALGLWVLKSSLLGALGLLPLIVAAPFVLKGIQSPPVADVMTQTSPPVDFLVTPDAENPLDPTPAVVSAFESDYTDIRPFETLSMIDQVLGTWAGERGWTLVKQTDSAIQFEVQSRLFGFIDDVVIHWSPTAEGDGSIIQMRSKSRVGVSDLGANAQRLRDLKAQLQSSTD